MSFQFQQLAESLNIVLLHIESFFILKEITIKYTFVLSSWQHFIYVGLKSNVFIDISLY